MAKLFEKIEASCLFSKINGDAKKININNKKAESQKSEIHTLILFWYFMLWVIKEIDVISTVSSLVVALFCSFCLFCVFGDMWVEWGMCVVVGMMSILPHI